MGMYTQIRGWLNVDSISYDNEIILQQRLLKAQEDFKKNFTEIRSWVCADTVLHVGSNGSAYLFFGTELKNYDQDAEKWIKHLITYFSNAEGRIDFQYEEDTINTTYWLVAHGQVVEEGKCHLWCGGYGNCNPLTHEKR